MVIKMFALALLILHFVLAESAKIHIPPQHGGKPAKPHQYPWIVTLQVNLQGQPKHICGGSLIAVRDSLAKSDIAVTAAHCLSDIACDFDAKESSNFSIIAGDHLVHKKEQGEQRKKLSRAKCHPNWSKYSSGDRFDIALIKFESPIEFTSTVKPIRLPKRKEVEPKTGSTCIVAGWGYLNRNREKPTELQHANATIESEAKCQEYWKGQLFVEYDPKLMICAGAANGVGEENRAIVCPGDSGGPLMCDFDGNGPTLTGIVSWGDSCPLPISTKSFSSIKGRRRRSRPVIYTKVSAYLDWIQETIKELSDL